MDRNLWKKLLHENTLLNEAIETADEFVPMIEKTIKKHFPKSTVQVKFDTRFASAITIQFAVGTKQDWSHGYFENDISRTTMMIWGFDKEGNMPKGKIQLDPHIAGKIYVIPGPGSYNAYDSVKVPIRKKTGTPEQVLKSIDKYFSDLKSTLKANKDKFSKSHEYATKYI